MKTERQADRPKLQNNRCHKISNNITEWTLGMFIYRTVKTSCHTVALTFYACLLLYEKRISICFFYTVCKTHNNSFVGHVLYAAHSAQLYGSSAGVLLLLVLVLLLGDYGLRTLRHAAAVNRIRVLFEILLD